MSLQRYVVYVFSILFLFFWPYVGFSKNKAYNSKNNYIILSVGHSHFLKVSKKAHIHVTNGKVIKVLDQKSQIKLTGYKKGSSSIWIGSKLFKVFVFEEQKYQFYISAKKLIEGLLGLTLSVKNKKIVISGTLHRLRDWVLLSHIHKLYPVEYFFETHLDTDLKSSLQNHLEKLCYERNLPVPTMVIHSQVKLFIGAANKSYLQRLNHLFSSYGLKVQIEKNHIALKPMIQIQVYIMEVVKSVQKQIGIDWKGGLQAQILPLVLNTSSLEVSLKAISQQGQGQVLASPVLLSRSGSEARFVAGGEFPIKVRTVRTQSVQWKRYGIILKIKPEADHAKNIKVELSTEVSELDMAHAVDGVPALKINSVSSEVNLKSGQLIALSGLIKNNTGHSVDGIPGLKNIPILGKLFSSQSFKDEKSELVVFIKPMITYKK